jgi:uroporphyrinogen-III decarboxylase
VGKDGLVIAGELWSPLKALHLLAGAVQATYLMADHQERVRELLALHERAQLDLVRQMAAAGVPAMMAMDNLDTAFHTPAYVEKFSASFYEQASAIAHAHDSAFFIHACGRQRANLRLIDSLGVDGLEGVAFPPLGDVELDEAFRMTSDRFLITGGISAFQTRELHSRQEVFSYVQGLLERLQPFAHRFVLASSCNTAIDAPWETLKHFRDAWQELGG